MYRHLFLTVSSFSNNRNFLLYGHFLLYRRMSYCIAPGISYRIVPLPR